MNTSSVEFSVSQSFQALCIGRILQIEVEVSSGWTLVSVALASCELRDDLVCIGSASAAMEMAAMYYENRMTADWTYDIASLEHGRLPDCH